MPWSTTKRGSRLSQFTRSDVIKLDVVVLIDSSESVLPDFEQEITEAHQLISRWPGNQKTACRFCHSAVKESTSSAPEIVVVRIPPDRLASVPKGGATPLFDAIETATDFLVRRRQPDVWPMIILFSDGEDTTSQASLRGTLKKVLASEAQVYAIDVCQSGASINGAATLQRIADDSGGRYSRSVKAWSESSVMSSNDLHSARVVTYVPPRPAQTSTRLVFSPPTISSCNSAAAAVTTNNPDSTQ